MGVTPTGYESKIGGNYDLMPVLVDPPAPTPLPDSSVTSSQAELQGLQSSAEVAMECPWRVFWPEENNARITPPVFSFTTTRVLVAGPTNHASGQYMRVAVPSPVDRSVLYTDSYLLPYYAPTVVEIFPPSIPLTGGVINLIGYNFGLGGRVYIRQHVARQPSDSDSTRRRLLVKQHDVLPHVFDGPAPVDPDTVKTRALDVQSSPSSQLNFNASSLFVYSECLLLAWSHTHIRCLAPGGYDPTASVVIDVAWTVTVTEGLNYRPSFLCTYNTTFDEVVQDVQVATFFEKYRLGMWSGFVLGFGAWLALGILVLKAYNKGPQDIFQPGGPGSNVVDEEERPDDDQQRFGRNLSTLEFTHRGSTARPATAISGFTSAGSDVEGDGSFIGSEYDGSKSGRVAPPAEPKSRLKKRRNTDELIMDKQVAMIDSVEEDDDLTQFLREKGLLTGTWKRKERRPSDASYEEMREKVNKEAQERTEAKEKAAEEKAYRKKHGLDRYGNKILKRRWWQCCCCAFRAPPPPEEEAPPSDDDDFDEEKLTPRTRARLAEAEKMLADAMAVGESKASGPAFEPGDAPMREGAATDDGKAGGDDEDGGDTERKSEAGVQAASGAGGVDVDDDSDDDADLEAVFAKRKAAIMGRREVNRFPSASKLAGSDQDDAAALFGQGSSLGDGGLPSGPAVHPLAAHSRPSTADVYKQSVFGVSTGSAPSAVPPLLRSLMIDSDSDD